jgi:hypothetical protein
VDAAGELRGFEMRRNQGGACLRDTRRRACARQWIDDRDDFCGGHARAPML